MNDVYSQSDSDPVLGSQSASNVQEVSTLTVRVDSGDLLHMKPPHNLELEKTILATLMNVADSFEEIGDMINRQDFYAMRHQQIFSAISHLAGLNEPYDFMMVFEWLERQDLLKQAGGEAYLSQIIEQSPAAQFNLTAYAERVRELSILRQLIDAGRNILSLAYNTKGESLNNILDKVEADIFAINERYHRRSNQQGPVLVNQVLKNVIDELNLRKNMPNGMIGLETSFLELNNKTQGLQAGDLIIVAARPSMGKTTFAMNLVQDVVFKHDLPAVVFSMEMPAESIVMRMLSAWGAIPQQNLRSGNMSEVEWASMMNAMTHLHTKKLYIDDSTALPPSEIRARCRRIAKENDGKIGIVMIDYMQLMKVPNMDNRLGEISEISRSLKSLARELNCPVIALSQLNRSLEHRPDKKPIMSDLRESGAIEQDADLIMFIYREEVYKKDTDKKGIAEIIIGKQRNGPIGTVNLAFEGQYTRFSNLTPEFYQAQQEDNAFGEG